MHAKRSAPGLVIAIVSVACGSASPDGLYGGSAGAPPAQPPGSAAAGSTAGGAGGSDSQPPPGNAAVPSSDASAPDVGGGKPCDDGGDEGRKGKSKEKGKHSDHGDC